MRWPDPAVVRSVAVLRLSSLGDVVLCEPVVRAVADRYPGAPLRVVTRTAYLDVFRHHPRVAAVHPLGKERTLPAADLAVDLHGRLDTRRLAARSPHRIRWRKRGALDLLRGLLGRPLHTDPARSGARGPSQTERMARDLGLGGVARPRLWLGEAWRAEAGAWEAAGPRAVILPATPKAVKRWPEGHFIELARRLRREGVGVLIGGGPGEGPQLTRVAAAAGAQALPAALPVGVLAAVIARADLAVGNDSGLLHVAAAVGTPVVALFGPTPPDRWGPAAGQGVALHRDPPCGPCSDHGSRPCRQRRRHCLDDLSVDRVHEAARRALRGC